MYVVLIENEREHDKNLGRGELFAVYEDLEDAIKDIRNQWKDDDFMIEIPVIYEVKLNQMDIDINRPIIKSVWRLDNFR